MTNQIALATKTEAELIRQQAFNALQDASNLINKSYLSELRYCDIAPRFDHKINLGISLGAIFLLGYLLFFL